MVSIIAGDSHTWRLLPVRYLNPKEIPKDAAWSAFFNPAEGQEQPALLVERSGDFVVIIMPPDVSKDLSGTSGDVLLQVSGKNLRKTFLVGRGFHRFVGKQPCVFQVAGSPVPGGSSARFGNLYRH